VAPLDEERLVAAMRHQLPEAHIEILEFSRTAAPEGEIQFPLAGLRHGAIGQTWNGWVTYAGNRRFPIWARVKVTVSTRVVVAAADLKAGAAIEASQLHIETRDNLPGISFLASTADVEGRVLRRAVAAGTPIQPQWLEAAKDVTRGDQVKVEVRSGNARLELTGEAEASGAAGQTIPVLNPISKKRFRARIEGKGRVVVEQGVS
jgi:flagella basal body P-ring formation protein FlgA